MAKNKNGKNKQSAAKQKVQLQIVPQTAGKKKRNRRRKSGSTTLGALSANFSLRSDYARAVLDPFNVRGARVPDSFMLRTGVACTRSMINQGKPVFNFSNTEVYVYINAAPLYPSTSNNLVAQGVTVTGVNGQPGNFGVLPATNVFNSANWSVVGSSVYDAELPTTNSYRVTGGGLRVTMTGCNKDSLQGTMWMVPSFNGDGWVTNYQQAVGYCTRSYTFDKDKATVTMPFPIRNTNTAYNWVKSSTHPTSEIDDYPEEDGPYTTAQLRSAFAQAVSTDNSTANAAILAWSMSSGLGGQQVVLKVPPGASWSCESIVHIEYQAALSNSIGHGTVSDESYKVCLANRDEIEAVGNAAAATTALEHHAVTSDRDSIMGDLKALASEAGGQVAEGLTDALRDTQVLKRVVGMGIMGGVNAFQYMNRARMRRLYGGA